MKVPTLENQGQYNILQPVNPSPEAFGVGVAQTKQQTGETVQAFGKLLDQNRLEMQLREDARKVTEAGTNFRKELDDLLYNQEKGLTNKKLSSAYGVTETFKTEAEKLKQKYAGSLGSGEMQADFTSSADQHIEANTNMMAHYEAGERQKGDDITHTDNLNKSLEDISRNPTLDNFMRLSGIDRSEIESYGVRNGKTKEMIAAEQNQHDGQLAGNLVIVLLSNGKTKEAEGIYNQYKDQIYAFSPETFLKLNDFIKDADLKNIDTRLNLIVNNGSKIQSDESLDGMVNSVNSTADELKNHGYDDDAIALQKQKAVSGLIQNAVGTAMNLEKDPTKAQRFLDKYKGLMGVTEAAVIQDNINKATFSTGLDKLWDTKLKAYTLEDGTPDVEKQLAALDGLYQGEDLVNAQNYIMKKANLAEGIMNAESTAKVKNVTNLVDGVKMKNGSKSQALVILNEHKADLRNHDYVTLTNYIDEMFKPPTVNDIKTNPGVYIALWEGIKNKTVSTKQLDQAYTSGMLSGSDWKGLREDLYNEAHGVIKEEDKVRDQLVTANLKRLAAEKNLNKDDTNNFLYYMNLYRNGEGKGKTPEEIQVHAEKMLQTTGGWNILGVQFGGEKGFKAQLKLVDENNQAWGGLYTKYGNKDLVFAIGQSITLTNKKSSFSVSDMTGFEKQIGGFDDKKLKVIQQLYTDGQLITPKNVQVMMQVMYPGENKPAPKPNPPKNDQSNSPTKETVQNQIQGKIDEFKKKGWSNQKIKDFMTKSLMYTEDEVNKYLK